MAARVSELRAWGALLVAFLRASLLVPIYLFTLTLFALWPWRSGPPFFLVRPLGFLRRAPRASALRLIMLRLELRTEWNSRAPGRVRAKALREWSVRFFHDTWPACRQLARRERRWSGLSRTQRRALFLYALPDSLRYGNGIATRFWFDPDRRHAASNHIPNLPYHIRLGCCLLNHAGNPDLPRLQRHFDKAAFYETCRAHGWPTVPVFASFTAGAIRQHEPLCEGPLISKPTGLAEGRGHFERWWPVSERGVAPPRYRGDDGRVWTYEEMLAHLARRSLDTPYLLQALLRSHAEIRALAGVETLCTLRVPTCCHTDGRAEALPLSLFRMPSVLDTVFDNMAQGGISYRVDLETGRLQAGVTYGSREEFRIHPVTDREAVGFALPYFAETVDLVVKAHAQGFPTYPTVGWDIALTPDGPVLVEMNIQWGAEHSIPQEGFLGATAYTDCVLGHLRRLWPESVGSV